MTLVVCQSRRTSAELGRWKVLVVGKKELHSPSLKGKRGKVYMRKRNLYIFALFAAGFQGQIQIWNKISNSNFRH